MTNYPKQDKEVVVCVADGTIVTGNVNIAGRSISSFIQDIEPDIILYNAVLADKSKLDTMMVTKRQILWISVTDETEKEKYGQWERLTFRLINGSRINGVVDITGYDRISDYVQRFNHVYHEVYESVLDGQKKDNLMFVSRRQTVWKEP